MAPSEDTYADALDILQEMYGNVIVECSFTERRAHDGTPSLYSVEIRQIYAATFRVWQSKSIKLHVSQYIS